MVRSLLDGLIQSIAEILGLADLCTTTLFTAANHSSTASFADVECGPS